MFNYFSLVLSITDKIAFNLKFIQHFNVHDRVKQHNSSKETQNKNKNCQ